MGRTPGRPDLYVIARFLDRLAERPCNANQLQLAVRLNYDIYRRYLALLEERGYLVWETAEDSKPLARLTPAGLEARRRIMDAVREWLKESRL